MGLATAISGDQMIKHRDWNIINLSRIYAIEARYTYFLSNTSSACANASYKLEHTTANIIFSVEQFLQITSRRLCGFLCDILLLAYSLHLWFPMNALTQLMKNSKTPRDVYAILEGYTFMKEASTKVNDALSPLIFVYIFDCILFLSSSMDSVLVNPDWFGKIRILIILAVMISMTWFCSELCVMVSRFQNFLVTTLNIITTKYEFTD